MSGESSQHFLHRKGNGLETSKKTSRYQKVCHSIIEHLRDALKIVVGHGKEQSREQTSN
jgi:hypothetical protein